MWKRGAVAWILALAACAQTEEPSDGKAGSGGVAGTAGSSSIDGSTWQTGGTAGDAATDAAEAADVSPSGMSCSDILIQNPSAPNGTYFVSPVATAAPVEVYCDMTGGGFTLAFLSARSASGKTLLTTWHSDQGAGSLTSTNEFYAVAGYGGLFHHLGIELRLTWLCGTDVGPAEVVAGMQLSGGSASWKDNRTLSELLASNGSYHQSFSDFTSSGEACFSGEISASYVYGFSVGNGGGYGQYLGWFDQNGPGSSAVSDGAFDNVDGTVAGWFR